MTIETTTATTTNTTAVGANFQVTVYEQKLDVFCDLCGDSSRGAKETLRARGWSFWNGSEFCPTCND